MQQIWSSVWTYSVKGKTDHDKIVGLEDESTSFLSGLACMMLGLHTMIQTIMACMKGIKEESTDSIPYKESVPLSATTLAGLIQVQGKAIRGIELGTNKMTSSIEAGVAGLKADICVRPI
jgi:hypothetical protein